MRGPKFLLFMVLIVILYTLVDFPFYIFRYYDGSRWEQRHFYREWYAD